MFAIHATYDQIHRLIAKSIAERVVSGINIPENLNEVLYSEQGRYMLEELLSKYEKDFKTLVREVKDIDALLVVVYIPSHEYYSKIDIMNRNRMFYKSLTEKYNVYYIDMTEEFLSYPSDVLTLLPEDGHLSRYGNKVVASRIKEFIDTYGNHRSSKSINNKKRINLLGDYAPNENSVRITKDNLPYRVITNNYGLRMTEDPDLNDKNKQRILVLGDSYTYGPYLGNQDTYPEMLNRIFENKIIINAGVSGYTIPDETSLFVERAKYTDPDIVVLQVIDNDISPDMFYFQRNLGSRDRVVYKPSANEEKFMKSFNQ